jgi:hypothetical protein
MTIRADQVGDFARAPRAQEYASRGLVALDRRTRIRCGASPSQAASTAPVRQIFDRHLGAQSVKPLVGERLRQRARAVDQEAAAVAGRRLGDEKIRCYLALRGQQGPEAAEAGPKQRNI